MNGEKTLFAARRWVDGSPKITLVDIRSGDRFPVEESVLQQHEGLKLGDFLSWSEGKLAKKSYLTAYVNGDIAYVNNIRAKLVNINGLLVFQSVLFAPAICNIKMPPGDYEITINLLQQELKSSGIIIHFEASQVVPIRDHIPFPPPFAPRPVLQSPAQVAPSPVRATTSGSTESPILGGSSNGGSRASTPAGKEPIIRGTGFQPKPKPPKNTQDNNKKVFGQGFKKEENPQKKVFVGSGFSVPEKKEEKVIVGSGFEVKQKKQMKLRAVVLSISENEKNKTNTHFLWILDEKTEGRFVSKDYKLKPGHFFEGMFIENTPKKWNCEKYETQIEMPAGMDGGLDYDQKIWFAVTINNFKPAGGNRRFGNANAKYFGEVIEGELESTKLSAALNGKKVKIQRKGIAERDYVWMVIEIL